MYKAQTPPVWRFLRHWPYRYNTTTPDSWQRHKNTGVVHCICKWRGNLFTLPLLSAVSCSYIFVYLPVMSGSSSWVPGD